MPTIHAFIMAGHPHGPKQRLIAALTEAVVDSVEAPPASVCVMLTEVQHEHYAVAGKPAPGPRAVLQAFLIAGRSDAQKAKLIARLTAATASIGVAPEVVRVFIQDLPNSDFGLGGVTAAALGRGIDRATLLNQH